MAKVIYLFDFINLTCQILFLFFASFFCSKSVNFTHIILCYFCKIPRRTGLYLSHESTETATVINKQQNK